MSRHVYRGLIVVLLMSTPVCCMASAGAFDADTIAVPVEEQTSTTYSASQPQIEQLPMRGYESIGILQPGVVSDRRTDAIHIRGGGATDADYYVDGISQRDGFTGQRMAVVGNNTLRDIALQSGALDAAYGNASSGIINVRTTEGEAEFHGTIEASTDNFHGESYDYNIYSVALHGPIIRSSDKVTFSAAAERLWFGYGRWNWQGKLRWRPSETITTRIGTINSDADWQTYSRAYLFNVAHAPRTTLKNNSVWAEMTHALSDRMWYSLRGSWLKRESKTGDGVYFDDLWGYGRPGDGNPRTESGDLFYSWDNLHIDAQGNQIVTPTYDSVLTVPMFRDYDSNGKIDEGEPVYLDGEWVQRSFTFNFTRVDSVGIDESGHEIEYTTTFADEGHVWNDFEVYESSSVNGRFDLVAAIASRHRIEAGTEFRRHTLRYYRHYFPTRVFRGASGGFDDINSYGYDCLGRETDDDLGLNGAKHPVDMGAYLQDRVRFGDLTFSAGVRIDRFDYAAMTLRDPANPLDPDGYAELPNPTDEQLIEANRLTETDLMTSKTFTRLSPRFGVAFPIGPHAAVHMSAGRFYRRPDLENLYVNFDLLEFKVKTGGYQVIMGNPALEPLETRLYEIGVRQRLWQRTSVGVVGFYKDMRHLIRILSQPAAPSNYDTYDSEGSGWAKGVELAIDLRRSKGIAAELMYTLQQTEGEWRVYNDGVAWTVHEEPKLKGVFPFDQRHKLTLLADARAGAGEGPRLGSSHPFEHAGIGLVVMAASGFAYTPSQTFNEVTLGLRSPVSSGPINSERAPSTLRVDLKANKLIPLGQTTLDLYFWILNISDRDNAIDVYTSTGLPDNTGWLDTPAGRQFTANNSTATDISGLTGEQKYHLRQDDPDNFDTPRQIRFGVRVLF